MNLLAKERALGRFRVALTAARDPDGSPTAGACDVHGDGARVTRSLVASRRALVISAAQLPVAGLVAGRTRTRTALFATQKEARCQWQSARHAINMQQRHAFMGTKNKVRQSKMSYL